MADRLLFNSWGQVVRGREAHAVEVFNDAVSLYGQMQQDGRIERFDVALLDPHAGGLNGYFALHGSAAQMSALREAADFRHLMATVSLIVDDLRVVDGRTGDGIAEGMAIYTEAIEKVPQHA